MSNKAGGIAPNHLPPKSSVQTRWQFIDSSTDSRHNLTQVKRHVMQEYIRQKRDGTGQQDGDHPNPSYISRPSSPQPKQVSDLSIRPKRGRKSKMKGTRKQGRLSDKDAIDIDNDSVRVTASSGYTSITPVRGSSPKPSGPALNDPFRRPATDGHSDSLEFGLLTPCSFSGTSPVDMPVSPKSLMSAARTDPFNSLPIELDLEGKELFDFYVNVMPACSYGAHFRSQNAHNWYIEVFVPLGLEGPVAFQNTILVHAANTRNWVRKETETVDAVAHRDKATSMLRELLERNRNDISDEAIISSLSAAALEDFDPRPGHKEISWYHMRGAQEMIRARGGPAAFRNTRLAKLINWQDYILSGYETYGPSFSFEPNAWQHVQPLYTGPLGTHSVPSPFYQHGVYTGFPSQPMWSASSLPTDEIHQQCTEFVDFLKHCEQLSLASRNDVNQDPRSRRYQAFAETSLLYQILTVPPMLRLTASGDRKQFVARFVALVMLNAALWDYRYSTLHTETFLETLEESMRRSEVDTSGSVEALLQILLACNDIAVDSETALLDGLSLPDFSHYSPTTQNPWGRPWFAGRMLKVTKRLSRDSWLWVQELLFACLSMGLVDPCVSRQETLLRQEILDAPSTCYVMPALC
ncbi:hypothetical protein ARAM_001908 [Aspergillus rambellii]|uniref:Sigma-70 region 2 family protein n=1 Tax=Aspergillus rambellii TaxID=308745 RepID=A0A0F8U6R7_9EURO|nr:hypothetical protein ARAM_001908 [Aspergillus rambellii]